MDINSYLKEREEIVKNESFEIMGFLDNHFKNINILNFCNHFCFEAIYKKCKNQKINRFIIVNNRILIINNIFKSYKFQLNGESSTNTKNIIDFDNELIRINFSHSKIFLKA